MTVPEHDAAARRDAAEAERARRAAEVGTRGAPTPRSAADSLSMRSAQHAAAAKTRLAQVDAACAGGDTPALGSLGIERVDPILEPGTGPGRQGGKGSHPPHLMGARIVARPDQGEPLAQVVEALRCEAARASAGVGASGQSPLAVKDSAAVVEPEPPQQVVVEVRSAEPRAAEEILLRARRLASAQR